MFSNRSYNNNYLYSNRLISQFSNTATNSYNVVSEKYSKTSSLEKLVLFLVFIIIRNHHHKNLALIHFFWDYKVRHFYLVSWHIHLQLMDFFLKLILLRVEYHL